MDAVEPGCIVADVLLDQRVAAGIGNVFKSEVLWACEVHPATPIGAVGEPKRRELVEVGARHSCGRTSPRRGAPRSPGRPVRSPCTAGHAGRAGDAGRPSARR